MNQASCKAQKQVLKHDSERECVKSVCCLLLPVGVAAGVERKVVTVGA
jgi:hypothetical protein